jgi:hypothetical protein
VFSELVYIEHRVHLDKGGEVQLKRVVDLFKDLEGAYILAT